MGIHDDEILSRVATGDGHGENSSYFDGWKAYDNDPFHPIHNPNGVIQMGLAENPLCLDLMQDWIRKNPQASICTKEGVSEFKAIANFQDYHGLPDFRKAIAKFMQKARGGRARFDPERIVMSGGATGAQETIAFCLANPGTPSSFRRHTTQRSIETSGGELVFNSCLFPATVATTSRSPKPSLLPPTGRRATLRLGLKDS
ncbi:unnamed protein product [Musa textilis]